MLCRWDRCGRSCGRLVRGPACPGSRPACSGTAWSRRAPTACCRSGARRPCGRRRRFASRRSRSRSRRRSRSRACRSARSSSGGSAIPPGSSASRRRRCRSGAEGLFSYSNAGYWAAGREVARVSGTSFEEAMRARILEPLGLEATGYDDPGAAAARGHLQEGETGHRAVPDGCVSRGATAVGRAVVDRRRPAPVRGAPPRRPGPARRSDAGGDARAAVAGARRRLRARLVGPRRGRPAGARPRRIGRRLPVAAPARPGGRVRARRADEQLARAAGSCGASSRSSGSLPSRPAARAPSGSDPRTWPDGTRSATRRRWSRRPATVCSSRRPTSIPVTRLADRGAAVSGDGARGGVFGVAGGMLMSHRLDFPRPGFARIGWVVLPRAET